MKWEGISEFVNVAENESFTKAAKSMAISTAQVSRQVSALEKRLNIKLFYRTTRKVSLTEEGRVYYQHCRSVLDGLDAAERAVTNLQSKPQGKIKLTAPVTYGEQQILPVDTVIACIGQVSNDEVVSSDSAEKANVHVIGGAKLAAAIDAKRAIFEALQVARKI